MPTYTATPAFFAAYEGNQAVCSCSCECSGAEKTGTNATGDSTVYATPGTNVGYLNGDVVLDATDIEGSAFCSPWQHTRVYSNQLQITPDVDVGQGYNWLVFSWPYLVQLTGGSIAMVRGTLGSLWFDPDGMGGFVGRYGAKSTLVWNSEAYQYVLTLPDGTQLVFNDFVQTTNPQGLFYQQIQPGGETTTAISYTSSTGSIAEVQRSGTYAGATLTESFLYTFDGTTNQLQTLLLRRQHTSGGTWENVRQAVYSYYDGTTSFGSLGDLQSVQIQTYVSSTWTTIDTTAYRYHLASDSDGFAHALKYVINPLTYDRMVGLSIDPLTAADSVVADYADFYYTYDPTTRNVVSVSVEGGTETTSLRYVQNPTPPSTFNDWVGYTTATLPDSSLILVFTNMLGQYILVSLNDGGAYWSHAYQYDSSARLIQHALPSAVGSFYYDPRTNTLTITYNSSSGLFELTSYYSTSGSGAAPGYVYTRSIQQGTGGTPVAILLLVYTSVTVGSITVYYVSTQTVYRNADGTGSINTNYSYTSLLSG